LCPPHLAHSWVDRQVGVEDMVSEPTNVAISIRNPENNFDLNFPQSHSVDQNKSAVEDSIESRLVDTLR
jgi:hypothetical protein